MAITVMVIAMAITAGLPGLQWLHLHLRLDHPPPRLRRWRQRLQRHGAAQRRRGAGAVEQGRGEARPAVTWGCPAEFFLRFTMENGGFMGKP